MTMSEEEQYLKTLDKDKLLITPHDVYKWRCCVEGCERFGRIKDYGLSPTYLFRGKWLDISNRIFWCGKHIKYYKRNLQSRLQFKLGHGEDHLSFEKQIT